MEAVVNVTYTLLKKKLSRLERQAEETSLLPGPEEVAFNFLLVFA